MTLYTITGNCIYKFNYCHSVNTYFFMFTITNQSIINIRSETDVQNAKNVRKFEFRGHGLHSHLKGR